VAGSGSVPPVPLTQCIDPFLYNTVNSSNLVVPAPTSLTTCEEGDAIIEGEFTGSLTIAADNDIITSRDLTYQCADTTAGVASDLNPGSIAGCNTAGTNDVLSLVPTKELVVAGPTNQPFNGGCTSTNCGTSSAPLCTDNGTATTQSIVNVVPWTCDIDTTFPDNTNGVVIDAAVVDLTGSTYVQNFNTILGSQNNSIMYQNGTNINYFPGLNGAGSYGYNQVITYDQRLAYQNPPGLLAATDTVFNMTSFIVCGTINSALFPVTGSGVTSAQIVNCPTLP
jgi:hypothetical protein